MRFVVNRRRDSCLSGLSSLRTYHVFVIFALLLFGYFWFVRYAANLIPSVPFKTPFKGFLIIDSNCLERVKDYRSCESSKIQIADFSDTKLVNKVHISKGVDDPTKDYFIFITKGAKRAVRKFEPVRHDLPGFDYSPVFIPSNISGFLWELERAQFVDCLGIDMHRSMWSNRQISLSFIEHIAAMRDLLINYGITPILFGGTVLGWFRECSVISHTKDVDFGILATEYNPNLLESLKVSTQFELYWTLGQLTNNFEISVYAQNTKIDLFLLYPLNDSISIYTGGFDLDSQQKILYVYPNIKTICSGDLFGRLVFVPCNSVQIIEADHGRDWLTDVSSSSYVWYKTPKSIYNVTKMSKEETSKVTTCYAVDGCDR